MASSCTALEEAQLEVRVELPIVVVEEVCFSNLLQGLYYFFCVLDLAQTHLLGMEVPRFSALYQLACQLGSYGL